jgi:two-component system sensor histidine kinase VicK
MNTTAFTLIITVLIFIIAVLVTVIVRIKRQPLKRTAASNMASNLRDERLRFEIIINAIEDGVVLVDDQSTIQLFNPGAGQITGWSCEEAVGLSVHAVMKLVNDKNQPIEISDTAFQRAIQSSNSVRDHNAFLLNQSGKALPVDLNITPLLDDKKQVTGFVAVFRNVAEERAEEQRRADFISTASHEMRTPVAAIEGYLSLALNNKVATIDNRARDYLEKAHSSTQHLGQLFQDLLTSAKAEDGRLSSHPVPVELGAFLEQLTSDLKFAAEKKGLFSEFVIGSSKTINANQATGGERVVKPLYYSLVDADRMREVVTNLFDNAVKYTDQGKISIGLTGDDKVVQFYVRDTGPGIPADDVPHLFQKFYRVDNSATRTIGGTGLGLFICRKIVELYNGRIWVDSEIKKGSTFFINFPRLTTEQVKELNASSDASTELKPINSLAAS